jgi:O-antigen/teichoic acid export membrane protein
MKNKYRVLINNIGIFAIGNLMVKLIAFFLMPIYTYVLTTEQYGVAELLNNAVEIIMPLATLCIVDALYRYAIDDDADREALFTNAVVVVFIGILLVTAGCIIVHLTVGYKYIFDFLILYISAALYKICVQFARGLGQTKRYAAYGIINSLLLFAANMVLLVYLKGGVRAYLFSFTFATMITALISFFFSAEYKYFKIKKINASVMKTLLRFSIPNVPNMIAWWVNSASDRYIVLLFCGPGQAGLYTAASKLPAMVNVFASVFQQAWQYSTAKEIDNENEQFFNNVYRAYSYACIVVGSVVIALNKLVCKIVLKSDFYAAWRYLPLLLFAATVSCIFIYFGAFYGAKKNNTMSMVSTLIGAVINVVLNFILIPHFKVYGAIIATVISYFVIMVVRIVDVKKSLKIDIACKRTAVQLSLLLISAILNTVIESKLIGCLIGLVFVAFILVSDDILICKHKNMAGGADGN